MTIAEAFVEEGLQKGRKEGHQKGLREILDRQIRRRFPHEVTANHLYLINDADPEILSQWAEKLVAANSIDEVFSK